MFADDGSEDGPAVDPFAGKGRRAGDRADSARIHKISHPGRYFKVAEPLNVERPTQSYPLLVQAGSSEDGKDFESEPGDFQFDAPLPGSVLARPRLEGTQSRADLVIEMAVRENLTVRQILSRLGGGRGHFELAGTPDQVADTIIKWFSGGAADGFNIMAPALPSGLRTFIDQVLPILRRAGLFRDDYEGTTLREHDGLDVPPNQLRMPESALLRQVVLSIIPI